MDEVREYERGLKASQAAVSPPPEEDRVLSFTELRALIESGKVDQIPNNKIIPEKFTVRLSGFSSAYKLKRRCRIQEEAPSQSTASVRRKPWEAATVVDPSQEPTASMETSA